jgi:uncharacterized caspase-like protein
MRWLPAAILLACSLHAADAPPDAKTYALAVGISQYQKLPQDLWLQYPDADAKTFVQLLASGRGGAVPPGQMLLLTNEQATAAALRQAFRTFLKRPGKNDTVYILLAGHGTVDSRGAYILAYDSDPENLSGTAIPMSEIQALVESEVATAGHVILLADVCRAATIGSLKTAELGAVVEKLGEASGEMLGLMAARPRELSLEGPDFGGGHGAFTYSVLKGLEGAADENRDGFVTAGELIDFVTADVPKRTRDRQHPRDFGNMDNATRLSDLSKPGIAIP